MARLGISPPRLRGGRLRSLAVAALMVGALGAILPSSHVAHAAALACGSAPAVGLNLNDPAHGSVFQNIPNAPASGVQPPVAQAGNVMYVQVAGATCTVTASIDNSGNLTFPAGTTLSVGTYTVTTLNNQNLSATNACSTGRDTTTGAVTDANAATDFSVNYCAQVVATTGSGNVPLNVPCVVNGIDLLGDAFSTSFTVADNGDGTFTESISGQQKCAGKVNGIVASETVTAQGGAVTPLDATSTPELGSGELFATGIVPILGLMYLRRRRKGQQ